MAYGDIGIDQENYRSAATWKNSGVAAVINHCGEDVLSLFVDDF